MNRKITPPRKPEFGQRNECLECRNRDAEGKCRWTPGDYCRMLKSR